MNSFFTKNPIVGTLLTPSIIRVMNTAIRRNQPIAGNGIRLTHTAGGTIIHCTAKGGGGGGGFSLLYPFKCVPWVKMPEPPEGLSEEQLAAWKEEHKNDEPEYDGYRFYVPYNFSLFYNGMAVPFDGDHEDYREPEGYDDTAWRVYDKITKESRGPVYCEVYVEKQSGGESKIKARLVCDDDGGAIPQPDNCNCECSCQCTCTCGDDSVVFRFPICRVDKFPPEREAQQTEGKYVEQYQFGELVYWDEDNGPYKIAGNSFGNPYFWNGGVLMEGPNVDNLREACKGKIAAIEILDSQEKDTETQGLQIVWFTSISALNNANKAPDADYIPLYQFNDEGGVIIDFRKMPRGGSWAMLV